MDPPTRRSTRKRAPKRKNPPPTSGSTDSYSPFARKPAKKNRTATAKKPPSAATTSSKPTASPIAKPDVTMANANDQAVVAKAAKLAKRRASAAVKKAAAEPANMMKAIAHRNKVRAEEKADLPMVTALRAKKVVDALNVPAARVGDTVEVLPDLGRLGPARSGGKAHVTRVVGLGGLTRIDVRYIQCDGGRTEKDIGVTKFTVLAHAHQDAVLAPRARGNVDYSARGQQPRRPQSLRPSLAILPVVEALSRGYQRKKGWLRLECCGPARPKRQTDAWKAERAKGVALYRELAAHLAATGERDKERKKGKFAQRKKWKHGLPASHKNLNWAWGAGPNTLTEAAGQAGSSHFVNNFFSFSLSLSVSLCSLSCTDQQGLWWKKKS